MAHNALFFPATLSPPRLDDRRRTGLAGRSAGDRPRLRLETVPARAVAALRRAARAAGARLADRPDGPPGGRVVLIEGPAAAIGRLAQGAARERTARGAAEEIRRAIENASRPARRLLLARGWLPLDRTLVMGIVNVTTDSFSDGGRCLDPRAAAARAVAMADQGAAFIDLGGESTRPGSRPIPLDEELRRVLPALEAVTRAFAARRSPAPLLSIDTTRAEVARRAAGAGIDLINDISGMTFDPAMPAVAAETGLPVVLQHIRGTPRTMQKAPRYRHLIPDIARFLRRRIDAAVRAGVAEERIVIDPGIGFGKTRSDNLAIVRHLGVLGSLGRPILVGASRKSFLAGPLELPPARRLEGSLAIEALAIAAGAAIIRAHDVEAAVRAAAVSDAVARDAPRRREVR